MITGEMKNKVDKIWEIFWAGGINESAFGHRAFYIPAVY